MRLAAFAAAALLAVTAGTIGAAAAAVADPAAQAAPTAAVQKVDLYAKYDRLTPPVSKVNKILGTKFKATGPHLGFYSYKGASGETLGTSYCAGNATKCDMFEAQVAVKIYDTSNLKAVVDFMTPFDEKARKTAGVMTMRCTFTENATCGAVLVGDVVVAIENGMASSKATEKRMTPKRVAAILNAYKARR